MSTAVLESPVSNNDRESRDKLTPLVLVVDDSPIDRLLAGRLIGKVGGLRVEYAIHGRDALDAMSRETPAVVLTDMQMPEMGGLELVEQIRSDYPSVPVVVMTAVGSEEIAAAALQAGAASNV